MTDMNPKEAIAMIHAGPKWGNCLTRREYQVLSLIAEGCSAVDIAKSIGTSIKTVDNQRTKLMRKLGVDSSIKAARLFWAAKQQKGESII